MLCVLFVRYLKPGVNLDGLDALHQGLVDFRPVAIVKPQSQNPEKRQQRLKNTHMRSSPFHFNTTFDQERPPYLHIPYRLKGFWVPFALSTCVPTKSAGSRSLLFRQPECVLQVVSSRQGNGAEETLDSRNCVQQKCLGQVLLRDRSHRAHWLLRVENKNREKQAPVELNSTRFSRLLQSHLSLQ